MGNWTNKKKSNINFCGITILTGDIICFWKSGLTYGWHWHFNFFPWKCLWKILNFVYFVHGILGSFSDNFAQNSSVFHRGVQAKNTYLQSSYFCILGFSWSLRIPDSYDAKIAKICNFWTSWSIFQLIKHLFKIRQKTFLPNAPYM